jgi:formylglycine-generating enzyme required for sulfatase activity
VEPRCHDAYCLIPAGCFVKGSPPDEFYRGRYTEEQRETTLTRSFVMQEHELTQGEWEAFGYPNLAGTMDDGDGGTDCVAKNCPASTMTWFEAVEYANKLSEQQGLPRCIDLEGCTGQVGVDLRCTGYRQTTPSYYDCLGYRLPTAYEFEYAIRAGTTTAFYSGPFEPPSTDCIDVPHLNDTAWYCINSEKRSHPVKQKKPNAWGLFDMMGNVNEFIASNPDDFELTHESWTDPAQMLSKAGIFGSSGGAYCLWPSILRSAHSPLPTILLYPDLDQWSLKWVGSGFRLVRTLTAEEAAKW